MTESGWTRRAYLIAQLEAHYARLLRIHVVDMYDACVKMDERSPNQMVKSSLFTTWMESLHRDAVEGAEIVEAARQCPDSLLDDLVRWQTNPNWKAAMQRAGYEFDLEKMRWTDPDW